MNLSVYSAAGRPGPATLVLGFLVALLLGTPLLREAALFAEDSEAGVVQPGRIRPVITFASPTPAGMAPLAVHVNATASELGSGDWHNAQIEWDFDASAAEDSHMTVRDPRGSAQVDLARQQQGFNAAYLYREPGEYTIRLSVTNADGVTASADATVFVAPDTRIKVYVDAEQGSDRNSGASEESARRTLRAAFSRLSGGETVLFKRGQTFDTERGVTIRASNVVVGAYGTGAPPRLRMTGNRDLLSVDGANVVLRDVSLTSTTTAPTVSGPDAFSCRGDRVALWNVQFEAAAEGYPFRKLIDGGSAAKGLLLLGVDARRGPSSKYALVPAGSHTVALGCSFRQPREEALMRSFHGEHMLLAHSDFVQAGGAGKDVLRTQTGKWFCYFRNRIQGGIMLSHKRCGAHYTVIDGNLSLEDTGRNQNRIVLKGNTDHVMIRNNVFVATKAHRPILVGWPDTDPGPTTIDTVEILNNTFIYAVEDRPNDVLAPSGYWDWRNIRISNNLFSVRADFASRYRRQLINTGRSTTSLVEAKHNVFPDFGERYRYAKIGAEQSREQWQRNPFVGRTTAFETVVLDDLVAPEFALDPARYPTTARGARPARGVFQDYHGRTRARGRGATWSGGAVQFTAP